MALVRGNESDSEYHSEYDYPKTHKTAARSFWTDLLKDTNFDSHVPTVALERVHVMRQNTCQLLEAVSGIGVNPFFTHGPGGKFLTPQGRMVPFSLAAVLKHWPVVVQKHSQAANKQGVTLSNSPDHRFFQEAVLFCQQARLTGPAFAIVMAYITHYDLHSRMRDAVFDHLSEQRWSQFTCWQRWQHCSQEAVEADRASMLQDCQTWTEGWSSLCSSLSNLIVNPARADAREVMGALGNYVTTTMTENLSTSNILSRLRKEAELASLLGSAAPPWPVRRENRCGMLLAAYGSTIVAYLPELNAAANPADFSTTLENALDQLSPLLGNSHPRSGHPMASKSDGFQKNLKDKSVAGHSAPTQPPAQSNATPRPLVDSKPHAHSAAKMAESPLTGIKEYVKEVSAPIAHSKPAEQGTSQVPRHSARLAGKQRARSRSQSNPPQLVPKTTSGFAGHTRSDSPAAESRMKVITVTQGENTFRVGLDTGLDLTLVCQSSALVDLSRAFPTLIYIEGFGGGRLTVDYMQRVVFNYDGKQFEWNCGVAASREALPRNCDMVIGNDFLDTHPSLLLAAYSTLQVNSGPLNASDLTRFSALLCLPEVEVTVETLHPDINRRGYPTPPNLRPIADALIDELVSKGVLADVTDSHCRIWLGQSRIFCQKGFFHC